MPEEINTTFPHRPGYQAPEPEGYQPGRVIARAIAVDGTVVKKATAHIAHAKDAFTKHLSTMADQRHLYSTTGYAEQVMAFSETAAAKAVATAVKQVGQRREEAQAEVTKVLRALSPDGDTSSELRNTRFWDRTRRVLDTADGGKLGSAARQLISEAEPAELGVLLQELQPYLQSRGHDGSGWIDAAVAQAVPELAAAKAQLLQAEKSEQVVSYNAEVMARAFAHGSQPAALVDTAAYDPDAE